MTSTPNLGRTIAAFAAPLFCALVLASPAAAKSGGRVRVCDAVIKRVTPAGQTTTTIQAATRIWTRGASCTRARTLLANSIVQVGQSPLAPPTVCCDATFFANDADWWRRAGWKVDHGIGANTKATNGARFVVRRKSAVIRFTRWS